MPFDPYRRFYIWRFGLFKPVIKNMVPAVNGILSNCVEADRVKRHHQQSQSSSGPMSVPNRGIGHVTPDRKSTRKEYHSRFIWAEAQQR